MFTDLQSIKELSDVQAEALEDPFTHSECEKTKQTITNFTTFTNFHETL